MAIVEDRECVPLASFDDPDDYRPNSELAMAIDPARSSGAFVDGLAIFYERIAPGNGIPRHEHTSEEVLFLDDGNMEVALGDEGRVVEPGAVVFTPVGTAHGFRNVGQEEPRIHAVFPSREITIRYLERNPAPGTEGEGPAPPIAVDVTELLEGEAPKAVRELDAREFSIRPS